MLKQLLYLFLLGLIGNSQAQLTNAGHVIVNDVLKPLSNTEVSKRNSSNPTQCDGDTSMFPSYGSTAYNTVTVRKGSALGQFYDAPQDMTISGFRFFALASVFIVFSVSLTSV